MSPRAALVLALAAAVVGGCAATRPVGPSGAADDTPLALAEPWTPLHLVSSSWDVDVTRLEPDHFRADLSYRSLFAGGDGEARQTFMRTVQRLADEGGYSGYEILHYEEGITANRLLPHRVAMGEFRLLRSRIWPQL